MIAMILVVVCVGIRSTRDTHFNLTTNPDSEISNGLRRNIPLINTNPGPLLGVLALGYFIHPFVIPIL
jgi:hypothetical protein